MNHPLPEELFDAASANDPGRFAAHLASCGTCRSAWDRLRVGASLLDDAREDPPIDDLDWGRIDAAISAEAEKVAGDIRAGRLRAPRPWKTYAMGGLALAAAAAAAFYVRSTQPRDELVPVAHRDVPPTPAPAARVDGAVLLAAGGATQTPEGASEAVRLSSGAPLREGARVHTPAAGRAVFSVEPSVVLDVRANSDVSLTSLREDGAAVALAQGEVAVDREGEGAPVSVRAGRWRVGVEGDVVARVESHVVRVVVLSGRASVEADGVSRMQYTGPIVIELPDEGAARTAQGEAADASRIDLSVLRAGGTMWTLPALDPAATMSVRGRGPLPSSLEAIRVTEPVTLQARLGHQVMTLEVGSGRVLEWHAVNAVAAAQPTVHRAPTPAPSAIQSPEPEGRALTSSEVQTVSRSAHGHFQHCIATCQEQNRCREVHGSIQLSVDANGRASLGSIDPSVEGARTCLTGEAPQVRFPATGGAFQFGVPIR